MVLNNKTVRYLTHDSECISTTPINHVEALIRLVNHQFEQINSYDELTSEERKLITREQFEDMFK